LSTQPGGHVTARTEERAKRCYKKAERTGRAHNFFIASHPWDDAVGGKKLAGTRAGKQYYLAFDTELVIQSGCKLFRTDEAIISPDWVRFWPLPRCRTQPKMLLEPDSTCENES